MQTEMEREVPMRASSFALGVELEAVVHDKQRMCARTSPHQGGNRGHQVVDGVFAAIAAARQGYDAHDGKKLWPVIQLFLKPSKGPHASELDAAKEPELGAWTPSLAHQCAAL